MSVCVIVSGLPSEAVFSKLIYSFKGIFKQIRMKKFWIRELSEAYGVEGKQATLEFTNHTEARKARAFLNNLPFRYGDGQYHLNAHMADDEMPRRFEVEEDRGRRQRQRPVKRERQRSRSPGYRDEASKLDLEIELLRKQRLVIEEERRLLLEQKKLEMIREYGPTAMREFDDLDEPPRKRRPEPVQAKRPRQRTPPPTQKPPRSRPKGLPLFFQPCKKLIAELKPFIEKDATPEEAKILVKLIRAAIRKSLAVALDGKDYMPTRDIIKLYRDQRPKDDDGKFVAKILTNIRASYLTSDTTVKLEKADTKAVKEEKESENQKDDKTENVTEKQTDKENEGQGDQVTKDKVVPQETPANEENGTDAAANLGVQVKSELNVTQESENIPERTSEVSQPAENASVVSQPAENASVVSQPAENATVVSQPAENASVVSQPTENASVVSQAAENVYELTQEPENASKEVPKEPENVSAEAVKVTNDAADFDSEFGLEDTESATDLLTEGDLQDADDWVEEQ